MIFLFLLIPILCSAFTLEEKVGQLLMVCFQGEEVNEDARLLVEKVQVGGFIYYSWANGLHDPSQVLKLSEELQSLSKIPLLIAVDQEGGRVARLKEGFTKHPPNGEVQSEKEAFDIAYTIGLELKSVGININLAPVVDVNSNPLNPIIGDRSFGTSPDWVALAGKAALDGYRKAGIISTLKHFPGHGDTAVDSHLGLPVIEKSLEELTQVELFPFRSLSSAADAMMTAHILVPALDPKNPATVSKRTLDYLRNELGFKGVIVSDSLVMQGILEACGTVSEACIDSINAGCDLLILGGRLIDGFTEKELSVLEIQEIKEAIVKAALHGKIPIERIHDAFERVMRLKSSL